MRALVKQKFPRLWQMFRRIRYPHLALSDPATVFAQIYESNAWDSRESRSGPGSTLTRTEQLRDQLPGLIEELGVRKMVDAPCGDFNWLSHTELKVEYLGVDIVPALIEHNARTYGTPSRRFQTMNILTDVLPTCDLILCRDCLFHFSDRDVKRAIANFRRSGAQYLLTTTYPESGVSLNVMTGEWQPLNLQRSPFDFPTPIRLIADGARDEAHPVDGKFLGLWRLDAL